MKIGCLGIALFCVLTSCTNRDARQPQGVEGQGGTDGFEGGPESSLGQPFLDPDPTECYPDRECVGLDECPESPEFCKDDSSDPDSKFVPDFVDKADGVGTFPLHPAYLLPGSQVDFFPASQTGDAQVRLAEVPEAGVTLLEKTGLAYLEFMIGDLRIRVLNENSPSFGSADLPADATLVVREVELDELEFVSSFAPDPTGGDSLVLKSAAVYLASESGSPQATPVAETPVGVAAPGFHECKTQAIHQFIEGSYNGKMPYDMPPVKFPPVTDNGYSECTNNECIEMYVAWLRAHHNVWRARQMLELLDSMNSDEQRSYAWGRPGLDWQGEKVTDRTSPYHWFGRFSSDALQQTRVVVNKLWDRFNSNKVGSFDLNLRCPTSGGNVCNTTDGVIAHHIVVGQIDSCQLFFDLGNRCYDGEWDEENEVCSGFIVSSRWRRAEVMAHELLHHTTVNGAFVQDKHSHGHGETCLGNLKILESMYEYNNVRHLAGISNCNHNWLGRHNNDSYAFFLTTIGDMVYRGDMKTWPAWAEPTPQPPENCETGAEGCYCEDVNPQFDAPDGDYRDDKWCDDGDGEMTCQKTKFNASDTVGICTKCDSFRGGGCECDSDRPCDKGQCWGDLTANGKLGVGRCYEAPPPSWTCLADCKSLYNSDSARCYYDHPSGEARCIDGVICDEVAEYECFQEGKVCSDGACITECTSNDGCRYDGLPNELDLDYPSYYTCSQEQVCTATP